MKRSRKRLTGLAMLLATAAEVGTAAASGNVVKEFPLVGNSFIADRNQNIVYMSVGGNNSVAVLDMNTLELLETIFVGSNPRGMAISQDGNTLYVATAGASSLAVVDLPTRTLRTPIPLPTSARDVEVDADGRIYAAPVSSSYSSLLIYDPATGQVSQTAGYCSACYSSMLEISPDGKTLFVANQGLSPGTLAKYDVTGAAPVLIWQNAHGALGSNGQDLWLTPTGEHVYYAVGGGNGITGGYDIAKIDADGMGVLGTFVTSAYPREIVTSPDGTVAYAVHTSGHIDVWNAQTFLKIKEYPVSGEASELFSDKTGKYLLASFPTGLKIYEAEGNSSMVDEDTDGVDDNIDNCLGLYNPDQADADHDRLGDLCDPFPTNPNNEAAQCQEERTTLQAQLDSANTATAQCRSERDTLQTQLNACLGKPEFNDADGDGEYDVTDRCPNTPAATTVDDSGCSRLQFCGIQTNATACKSADWKNDEPTASTPGDCAAIKTGRNSFVCQPL